MFFNDIVIDWIVSQSTRCRHHRFYSEFHFQFSEIICKKMREIQCCSNECLLFTVRIEGVRRSLLLDVSILKSETTRLDSSSFAENLIVINANVISYSYISSVYYFPM